MSLSRHNLSVPILESLLDMIRLHVLKPKLFLDKVIVVVPSPTADLLFCPDGTSCNVHYL